MNPSNLEIAFTALFVIAILHTFSVGFFKRAGHYFAEKYGEGSILENLFHFLGEVEAVFMIWAGVGMAVMAALKGWHDAVHYYDELNFTEPAFVFVVMTIAATRPVVQTAERIIETIASLLPLPRATAFVATSLIVGPLLGSFITEPAAMTVTAMLLKKKAFDWEISSRFKYFLLGTLFVNVSIGGTLTNYAAPPILMIKEPFGWSSMDVLKMLGWKAAIACTINSIVACIVFRSELGRLTTRQEHAGGKAYVRYAPLWVAAIHLLFLAFTVVHSHHTQVFLSAFVFFLGFVAVTKEFQDPPKLKDGLMVGGFLAGLVTLGSMQNWWLEPTLAAMSALVLYFGATALTAVTDNAALTYLGSRVQLSPAMKYSLVAGAVTGGGLTVIANAPNPAGNAILADSFPGKNIGAGGLFLGALPGTIVAILCFLLLPNL